MIFIVLGAIITGLILLLVTGLSGSSNNVDTSTSPRDIQIWILEDSETDFSKLITNFQELYPDYKGKNIKIESFSDKRSYDLALSSAFLQNKGPDIFVLNNSETSVHENQVLGISPALISPNDFRLRFAPVFGSDLIISDPDDSSVEFLKWVPTWFEALGLFYNRKYFLRSGELDSWSSFASEIQSVAKKYSGSIVPVALWNGAWVSRSPEIIKALFTLEGNTEITDLDSNEVRDVVGMYQALWEQSGDNKYNSFSENTESSDIELFSEGRVAAIVWFPRDLMKIDEAGYQKSFLFATPLPGYSGQEKNIAISYNYYSINKESQNLDFAGDFLAYLSTSNGQQVFSDTYPYYLSPELSILTEQQEKKVLSWYNVVYKNFLNDWSTLVSFGVWNSNIYNAETKNILDKDRNANEALFDLKNFLVCATNKQSTLTSLSSSCK